MYMEVQLKRQDGENENASGIAAEGGADPWAPPIRLTWHFVGFVANARESCGLGIWW